MIKTLYCNSCNKIVEITEVKLYPDYSERILSCGHKSKLFVRDIAEPAISVSDTITAVLSRFQQSENVLIEEKAYGRKRSLLFSANNAKFIINSDNVNIYIDDTKVSQNISSTSILDKIQSLVQEVQTSSINDKERQPMLSLIERLKDIISPEPATENISKFARLKKWIF